MPKSVAALFLGPITALALTATGVRANPVDQILPGAGLRGEATYRHLGVPVYAGRLYTPGGAPVGSGNIALELTYLRSVSANVLVSSTMDELQRLGHDMPIRDALSACFSAVSNGDRYLAVTDGTDRLIFYRNGSQVCTVDHPQVARHFMAIFLGPNSRSPGFSNALLGQ